jgi:GDPmannose 4,6-dehydratase
MKKAFITGIGGQDGSYLSELLLEKGYEVHGLMRRSSTPNTSRISHILNRLVLHSGDMTDGGSLRNILRDVQPDEVYNLAAQSHVRTSFESPEYTANTDALGTLRLIEAARICGSDPKFYQASTSELFGMTETPQRETTAFYPRSPYGIAKLFAYWTVVNYRESGMFACNGILFNHESPRRGDEFVTQKIVKALVAIRQGKQDKLLLGNLGARRDWGYAKEYVEAMWLMLQQDKPEDFVIATGESHTIGEFLDVAAAHLEMDWTKYVEVDLQYFRPTEVDHLLGDASKAKRVLGWEPKVKFKELVKIMVEAELYGE